MPGVICSRPEFKQGLHKISHYCVMFGAKGLASISQWNCLAHCSRMYKLFVQVVHVRAIRAADTIQMSG